MGVLEKYRKANVGMCLSGCKEIYIHLLVILKEIKKIHSMMATLPSNDIWNEIKNDINKYMEEELE